MAGQGKLLVFTTAFGEMHHYRRSQKERRARAEEVEGATLGELGAPARRSETVVRGARAVEMIHLFRNRSPIARAFTAAAHQSVRHYTVG
eukprot:scaffold1954_cov268-Pinguiococcus_pyrenoidosus.AAC.88